MNKPILITKSGSHLYGTNLPTSDVDIRGIVYPPINTVLGLGEFEQSEEPYEGHKDTTLYSLKKFFNLALKGNPTITEMLFLPYYNKDIVLFSDKNYLKLQDNSQLFLSKKEILSHFVGYAYGQLKKMQTHYNWMKKSPPIKPNPEDYGRIIINEKEKWTDYNLKIQYDVDLKNYQQYQLWVNNRNPKRHQTEELYGFDCKNASHLVRTLTMGEFLLKNKYLGFPCHNKDLLLDILKGEYSYESILNFYEKKSIELEIIAEKSDLPDKPDYEAVNDLHIEIIKEYLYEVL